MLNSIDLEDIKNIAQEAVSAIIGFDKGKCIK